MLFVNATIGFSENLFSSCYLCFSGNTIDFCLKAKIIISVVSKNFISNYGSHLMILAAPPSRPPTVLLPAPISHLASGYQLEQISLGFLYTTCVVSCKLWRQLYHNILYKPFPSILLPPTPPSSSETIGTLLAKNQNLSYILENHSNVVNIL